MVNGWLSILLTTLRAAVDDLELERDPTRKVGLLDTSEWATYTEEEPNALAVEEIPRFMDSAWEIYPQHYAMLALGLVTGRRPSELRPLRRTGREPDIQRYLISRGPRMDRIVVITILRELDAPPKPLLNFLCSPLLLRVR